MNPVMNQAIQNLTERRAHVFARDAVAFAESLGFALDAWQADVLRSTGRRLLLNCSRQTGKSTVSAILAAHTALYTPRSLVLLISPSLRQSSELFFKVAEMLARVGEKPHLAEDNKLSCRFAHNGSRIISLPSSEATIRGFSGASLIVEDEASRVSDELYFAVRPMLAVSGGRLILMSTPFGARGHFHAEWTSGEGWERIEVPASECPRITSEFLEAERRAMGEWFYRQEYCCQFSDATDSVFASEDIDNLTSPDVTPLFAGARI